MKGLEVLRGRPFVGWDRRLMTGDGLKGWAILIAIEILEPERRTRYNIHLCAWE